MLRLLPFVLLAVALPSQDKIDLHLSVEAGQQLFFRHDTVRRQVTELRGIELVFVTKLEQLLQLDITEVDDGGIRAEFRVLRVRGSMVLPREDEPIEFDSSSDAEPDAQGIGPAQCAFVGRTYALRIGRDGDIVELRGAAEALAEAKKTATGLGKQMLGGQVDAGALQSLAQSLIGRLPRQPVAEGERWERERKDDFRGTPMLTRTTYTLGRCDGEGAELLVTGGITTPEAKAEQAHLREGKVTGRDVLERSGLVLSATRKTATVSEGPSPVGEGRIVVQSTSEHTLTRITAAAAKPPVRPPAKAAAEGRKDER